MMSIESIQAASDEAARKAAREKKQPYAIYDEIELDRGCIFKFPNLGSHVPKGWRKIDSLFCDHSGFGSPNEPALTLDQLEEKLREHIRGGNKYAYGITEAGQFQLYLGVFEKLPSKSKRRKS